MTWTAFTPKRGPRAADGLAHDRVSVSKSGMVSISPDLVALLGSPEKVALLTNDDPTKIGIRALVDIKAEQPYRLSRFSRYLGSQVNAYTLLWRMGYRAKETVELPHAWDGDVLVIDLSSLPTREG